MRTEDTFDALLEKLIDVAADKRLGEERRADLQSKLHTAEQQLMTARREADSARKDRDLIRANYEKLKAVVPAKMLAEHEKAIDDIPF